eukprot:6443756-Prymnesium_polylepis.1
MHLQQLVQRRLRLRFEPDAVQRPLEQVAREQRKVGGRLGLLGRVVDDHAVGLVEATPLLRRARRVAVAHHAPADGGRDDLRAPRHSQARRRLGWRGVVVGRADCLLFVEVRPP